MPKILKPPFEFSVEEAVNEFIADHREKREVKSWRPSGMGQCLTGRYLERKGVPGKDFNARQLRIFEAGKLFEQFVAERIKSKVEKYEEQVRLEWPEQDVTGYADGVINDEIVVEVKSRHSKAFSYMEIQGPPIHNLMQLWIAMKILEKKYGLMVYVSKDDLRISEYVIGIGDQEVEGVVMRELSVLNSAWKKGLPPRPDHKEEWIGKFCRWHELCVSQETYLN